MQLTTNYKLRKPDGTDNVDINDFNYNADIIDNTIKTHTHTKSQITDMPTSLKNPNALTIQLNGSSQGAYDGSSAKTINVTKSSIGLSNVDNVSKAQILASPALTGVPTAPTATAGTNTTQIATTAFVTTAVNNKTSVSGNAGTATKLQTARTINGVSFDGSQNITTPSISTGGNITLHADSDSSTTTEYASIKAGGNELKITSSGGGSSPAKNNNNLTFNGNVVYHAGKKPTPADIGASATGHTHDDRYYTESEINTKLNGKANSSHNHDIITGGNANRFDLTAPNDCCGLSKQNNVDIKSWYGVSISNACGNTGVQGRPTVSFDARTGNAWFEGDIFVKGQSKGLFQSASDGKTKIATAITGKGVNANSSDTFATLANKIGQIQTAKPWSSHIMLNCNLTHNDTISLFTVQTNVKNIKFIYAEFMNGSTAYYGVWSINAPSNENQFRGWIYKTSTSGAKTYYYPQGTNNSVGTIKPTAFDMSKIEIFAYASSGKSPLTVKHLIVLGTD